MLTIIARTLFWIVLWSGTVLIFWASSDYFTQSQVHAFLRERPHLMVQDWWRYSVYVHVFSGCLCLGSSLLQYSGILLRRYPKWHKYLGYIYVLSLILAVIPSGLILSVFAKGGWIGKLGFCVLNFATLVTVLLGLNSILKKRLRAHQAWITRSFGLVSSAITFRLLLVVMVHFDVSIEIVYPACVWLSIILNALLVEVYLYTSNFAKHTKNV